MNKRNCAKLEELTWGEAREMVLKTHPMLSKIIDKISPGKDFLLYKAYYPFGAKILNSGIFHLPSDDGNVVPINSPNISSGVKNNLIRRSVPVGIVLNHCNEVFYEMPERIITLNLFKPGYIIGLWEHLDPLESYYVKCVWTVISGVRSLYLLPKITDAGGHKELRNKYGIRARIPRNLAEEWNVFSQLVTSQAFESEWFSEILFFSDKWMSTAISDPAWKEFYNFMLEDGWNQSQYWRNKVTFDMVWELFIDQLREQNLKPNPYLVHIVKHIVLVGTGVLPAFAPAIDDLCAPIKMLQKVFIEDYKLREYIPTFMQPTVFDLDSKNPSMVYYSLQQPTLLETSLVCKRIQSVLQAMPEIAYLIDTFKLEVEDGTINAAETPIEIFAQKVNCTCFHNEANERIDNVRRTSEMPSEDNSFLEMSPEYSQRAFAATSRFLKGCVRFSKKLI